MKVIIGVSESEQEERYFSSPYLNKFIKRIMKPQSLCFIYTYMIKYH